MSSAEQGKKDLQAGTLLHIAQSMSAWPPPPQAAGQYQFALKAVQPMERGEAVEFLMNSLLMLYPPNFPKNPTS
jgi:hypothetical protein